MSESSTAGRRRGSGKAQRIYLPLRKLFLFLGAISYPADTFNNVFNDDVVGRKAAVAGLLDGEMLMAWG